jgi:hypothetical protein
LKEAGAQAAGSGFEYYQARPQAGTDRAQGPALPGFVGLGTRGFRASGPSRHNTTAKYQELAELEGNSHWAVLSSWFGPIVRKEVKEARHVKTMMEYIKQAVCCAHLAHR